ncbi:bacteriophage abortive infection AbiH family protein [Sphingobacterium sp. lm-10]|uniref:AbiH family protein n=1 Tax=Sphingobacterium sp. lm-10 TaxID=2944904 RepID=UPI0020200A8E|nr:AbiH family protein [Sphingobacterium sp. lm-10]MCL7987741.1 bacteriophage abortive infection AbiH family protein [Sphingobacterium sp. lm-10]
MNKLIIIGNGFDLAHGLKTSYGQFLKSYLINVFDDALENHINSDQLIFQVVFERYDAYSGGGYKVIANSEDLYDLFTDDYTKFSRGIPIGYRSENSNRIRSISNVKISTNSNLVRKLLSTGNSLLWVDIERIFYDELKNILVNNSLSQNKVVESLNVLNQELENLKSALLVHLNSEIKGAEINDIFEDLAMEPIESYKILERDFVNGSYFDKENLDFKKVTFLDFNYTHLIRKINLNKIKHDFIHIHGVLKSDKLPVIFGYGDEIDDIYHDIEKTNINEYMTHIKSFGYFKAESYSELKRTIESEPFVVYIWGHSCGLSDRTLLNMIFENDNCVGIKIFYYNKPDGTDNYDEITQNISRHFKNKTKMRNRVFNKRFCSSFPQMNQ